MTFTIMEEYSQRHTADSWNPARLRAWLDARYQEWAAVVPADEADEPPGGMNSAAVDSWAGANWVLENVRQYFASTDEEMAALLPTSRDLTRWVAMNGPRHFIDEETAPWVKRVRNPEWYTTGYWDRGCAAMFEEIRAFLATDTPREA